MRRDDGKPESVGAQRGYGLAAAVITDLVLAGRITLSDRQGPPDVGPAAGTGRPPGPGRGDGSAAGARRQEAVVAGDRTAGSPSRCRSPPRSPRTGWSRSRRSGRSAWSRPGIPCATRSPSAASASSCAPCSRAAPRAPRTPPCSRSSRASESPRRSWRTRRGTLGRRDLKRRIEEVSTEIPAGEAVAKAVAAMNTAIMTAAILPAIAAGGSRRLTVRPRAGRTYRPAGTTRRATTPGVVRGPQAGRGHLRRVVADDRRARGLDVRAVEHEVDARGERVVRVGQRRAEAAGEARVAGVGARPGVAPTPASSRAYAGASGASEL